ncbi:MAG: hypothetical protein N3F64_06600 [Nitrososphaeria archaeon]|nr:hypothetical protein [Nitrososphaeria archaeon]
MIRICLAFISKPKFEAGHPYVGFDNEEYKKFVLDTLKTRFDDITFIEHDVITFYNKDLVEKIKSDAKTCDGLIVYTIGQYGDPGIVDAGVELIELNLPTILANYPYGGDPTFLKIYDRVKGRGFRLLPISSLNFEDIVKAIEILRRILLIRGKKILLYTLDEVVEFDLKGFMELIGPDLEKDYVRKMVEEIMGQAGGWSIKKSYIDLSGVDQAHSWRRNEPLYMKNLREIFHVTVIRRHPDEILDEYFKISEDEVKKLVKDWKSRAKRIHPATSEKAIESAIKLYLVSKNLIKKYNVDAIAYDCGTLFLTGKIPSFPCFTFSKLMDEGIVGICESDLDSGISALLVRYLFDKPSIMTNQSLDTVNNLVTYMHCWAPTRLYGIEKEPLPYTIDRHGESYGMGAVPFVEFPKGEILTTIKVSILRKKIALRTGKIVNTVSEDDRACRVKVIVEDDVGKILEKYDWDTFGLHRVSFLGDYRREIGYAAKLLGLEIVEEDR